MNNTLTAIALQILCFAVGNSILIAQDSKLPKATELIDSFIEALGSEIAIAEVKTIQMSLDSEGASVSYIYHEGRWLSELTFEASPRQSVSGYDGIQWWANGRQLSTQENSIDLIQLQYSYIVPPDALRLRKLITDRNTVESMTIDGESGFGIRIDGDDEATIWLIFDANSRLLMGQSLKYAKAGVNYRTEYSFREIDGIMYVDTVTGYSLIRGARNDLSVQKIGNLEINGDVDESVFGLLKNR